MTDTPFDPQGRDPDGLQMARAALHLSACFRRGRGQPPAARGAVPYLYILVSATIHYVGPAFATQQFTAVTPLGVAWLRIASAAILFAAWRRPWRTLRGAAPREWLLNDALGGT